MYLKLFALVVAFVVVGFLSDLAGLHSVYFRIPFLTVMLISIYLVIEREKKRTSPPPSRS